MMLAGNIPFFLGNSPSLTPPISTTSCLSPDVTITRQSLKYSSIVAPTCAESRRLEPSVPCTLTGGRFKTSLLDSRPKRFHCHRSIKKVLGFVVTRDDITFDGQLFLFKLKPTTSPNWESSYNLINPAAEGAVSQTQSPLTSVDPLPDFDSDESKVDPHFDSSKDQNQQTSTTLHVMNRLPKTINLTFKNSREGASCVFD